MAAASTHALSTFNAGGEQLTFLAHTSPPSLQMELCGQPWSTQVYTGGSCASLSPSSGWEGGSKAHLQIAKPHGFFSLCFFVSFCFYNKPRIQSIIPAERSLSREEGRKIPCWQGSCLQEQLWGVWWLQGSPRLQLCLTMLPVAVWVAVHRLLWSSPHQVSLTLPFLAVLFPTYQQHCRQAWNLTTEEEFICQHSPRTVSLSASLFASLSPMCTHIHSRTRENRLLEKDWLWLKTQPRQIID